MTPHFMVMKCQFVHTNQQFSCHLERTALVILITVNFIIKERPNDFASNPVVVNRLLKGWFAKCTFGAE